MFKKQLFTILLITFNILIASSQNAPSQPKVFASCQKSANPTNTEKSKNIDEFREIEIEDLIKALEDRINVKAASDTSVSEKNKNGEKVANPRDRIALNKKAPIEPPQDGISDFSSDNKDKRMVKAFKIGELKKEVEKLRTERTLSPTSENHLSDFEKDEQYYKALVRLQKLYHMYNKQYPEEKISGEDRRSRHCGGGGASRLSSKLESIQSSKLRYMEKSRLLADRIAESAIHLVRKKDCINRHLGALCSCYKCNKVPVIAKPAPVVVVEEAAKRDVSVASSSASAAASSTNINAGGISIDSSLASSSASAASIGASLGGSSSSISAASASSLASSSSLSVGAGASSSVLVGNGNYYGQLISCDDYEKKMIMDMAIDEAAAMIRNLAYETRSEYDYRNDPFFERRVLELAVEFVNKVTEGATGTADSFASWRYNNVDEYLKSSIYDGEIEADLISNSGFDYVGQGFDGNQLGQFDDYVGHPSPFSRGRCDTCMKYDLRQGNTCPLCKRSGGTYKERAKRRNKNGNNGKIYHMERASDTRKITKSAAVWEDVNKLYNFDHYENNKFIDLSLNCSEENESTKRDCERLNFALAAPRDSDPVPLRFVKDYLSHGRDLALDMHERARGLQARPAPHSPSMLHFMNNRVADSLVKLGQESQLVLYSTKMLQEKLLTEYNITPNSFLEFLQHHGFRVTGSQVCRERQKRCDSSAMYRSIEGSCNNMWNPSWGRANTAFVRVLTARYADGIHALPRSVTGRELPNPRSLSSQLFSRRNATDSHFTLALMQWGQMLAHDLARQVIDQTAEGGIECCESTSAGSVPLSKSLQHHSCAPIVVPKSDKFYARFNQSCMNFVRSMTVASEDCLLGPADQVNAVSSYLDLSPVYGASKAQNTELRELSGGLMRTKLRYNRAMMPTTKTCGLCDAQTELDTCFETGDTRTNQNPQLVVLQTLLIREHNRVAYELAQLNPHWSDERLFQESRRIVIAEYQHITYRYWLPLVIGKKYCTDHGVCPQSDSLTTDYDAKINPGAINGFTAGAFRFLHTLIEGSVNLVADNYATSSILRLSNHYFRPQVVEANNNFESLLRGLVTQPMQKSDANFHQEVTEYLFRSEKPFGMDLEAIDIQRGRDHGLPGYNAYREICNLNRAQDFDGLINEISLSNIDKLERMYEHVDDIDLLVGATLESKLPDSMLGPTLQCLISEQFYRTRLGDKYFYNNADFMHSFTPDQFEQLRKANLATLICDLGEAVYQLQRNPFKVTSRKNPTLNCFHSPRISLEPWKEKRNERFY